MANLAGRAAPGRAHAPDATAFAEVLKAHYHMHPCLEPQDVYKLIYQRVFGPEHSIDQLAAARERLYLEVLQLPDAPASEPLVEPLSPVLCRVNLQPFRQQGGNIASLWSLFRQSVSDFQPGTRVELQRTWRLFLGTSWAQRYAPEALEQFWQRMATADFPPVHHSPDYARVQAPHYRVVLAARVTERLGISPLP